MINPYVNDTDPVSAQVLYCAPEGGISPYCNCQVFQGLCKLRLERYTCNRPANKKIPVWGNCTVVG